MGVLVTLAGQARFAAAAADGGSPLVLDDMALGDGGGAAITPLETATGLTNEVYRIGLQSAVTDPGNPNWLVCKAIIPAEAGPFTIREIGIFDSVGTLIAIADYPDTVKNVTAQGIDTTLTIELVLVVSETANVTVVASSGTYATQEYVDNAVPDPATVPEHLAGELETKWAHPKGVDAMIDAAIEALPGAATVPDPATVPEHLAGALDSKWAHPLGVGEMIGAAIAALPADEPTPVYFYGMI